MVMKLTKVTDRSLSLIEHEIKDGRTISSGAKQTISKRMQFARLGVDGEVGHGGIAPHLNLRQQDEELRLVEEDLSAAWLKGNIEDQIKAFSIEELARAHLSEVTKRRLPQIDKVEKEVVARLKQEIRYWDSRAATLLEQERAGENTRLSSKNAQRRADDLNDRLQKRLDLINLERAISAIPPVIKGGLVIVPQGLIDLKTQNKSQLNQNPQSLDASSRREVELAAMDAVMQAERALGNEPEDVSARKEGYDIVSLDPDRMKLRFIEVKGRAEGADTVTITKNEIITGLNKKSDFALAIVQVDSGRANEPRYVWDPFDSMPSANGVH